MFGRGEYCPCLNDISGDYLRCLRRNVVSQKPGAPHVLCFIMDSTVSE